jgi:hypothetical protein
MACQLHWLSVSIHRASSPVMYGSRSFPKEKFTMTLSRMRHLVSYPAAYVLLALLGLSGSLPAQTHVVSPADLQKEAAAASATRQHNLETINGFLSSPKVEEALGKAGLDPAQLKTAVSTLKDEELARLAARSQKAQSDLAAGTLTERDLIIILICIAALILIIVAVR